jgi:muramoyltetrapeptide carboxypeptidase
MIRPEYLKEGDRIGLVAPARKISASEADPAIRIFRSWGLQVIPGESLFRSDNQFAGSDRERAADLQQMLDDPTIRAIVCARGGYGTLRIMERLDFTRFIQSPKWIVGFSDITVLHIHLSQELGVESIHGPMVLNLGTTQGSKENIQSLKMALFGQALEYTFPGSSSNRQGSASGVLTGGNLSILYSLRGTRLDPVTENRVLFIEDVDEYLYHLDRMMLNLKMGEKLDRLEGLICGGLTEMKDNKIPFGKEPADILCEAIRSSSYPVCFHFPSGHGENNLSLIMGRTCALFVEKNKAVLRFAEQ